MGKVIYLISNRPIIEKLLKKVESDVKHMINLRVSPN